MLQRYTLLPQNDKHSTIRNNPLVFSLRYTVQYGGKTVTEDVTRILSGKDRKFYSFGKWEYPGTDFHKVIITDKYGGKTSTTEKDCGQLKEDENNSCKV